VVFLRPAAPLTALFLPRLLCLESGELFTNCHVSVAIADDGLLFQCGLAYDGQA